MMSASWSESDLKINLTPYLVEKAKNELNETKETIRDGLDDLMTRILEEEKLNLPCDPNYLLRFLRVSKYDSKKAFDRLRAYYEGRKYYKEDFKYLLPSVLLPILQSNINGLLPLKDKEGSRILYISIENWDANKFQFSETFRVDWLSVERALDDEECQVSGVWIVFNCEGFCAQKFLQATPSLLYKYVKIGLKCLPFRIKGVHILHENAAFRTIYSICKPFLSKKVRDRVHFYGNNVEGVHQYLDPKLLPEEAGGTNGKFDNTEYIKSLKDWETKWQVYREYGYRDEN